MVQVSITTAFETSRVAARLDAGAESRWQFRVFGAATLQTDQRVSHRKQREQKD